MTEEKRLIHNTMIVSFGKICTRLITFLLLPLYTACLSASEYGSVDLVGTVTGLLSPVVTLMLDQGLFRFLIDARDSWRAEKRLISSAAFFLAAQGALCAAVCLAVTTALGTPYRYCLLGCVLTNCLTGVVLQIARGFGSSASCACGSFLSAVMSTALNVVLVACLGMGARGMLLSTISGRIVCVVYVCRAEKIPRFLSPKSFDRGLLREMLRYSLPLIPNQLSWWAVNASDRLIILHFLGIGANGVYSIANKFSGAVAAMFGVFSLSWTESASLSYRTDDRDAFFSRIYDALLRVFGCATLLVTAAMPLVFPHLINGRYAEAFPQIPILMAGTFFNILVSFLGSVYIAAKRPSEVARTTGLAAMINISMHLLLICGAGLYAASLSTFIAWFSMYLLRRKDTGRYVRIRSGRKTCITLGGLAAVTLAVYDSGSRILTPMIFLLNLLCAVRLNRGLIRSVFYMSRSLLPGGFRRNT